MTQAPTGNNIVNPYILSPPTLTFQPSSVIIPTTSTTYVTYTNTNTTYHIQTPHQPSLQQVQQPTTGTTLASLKWGREPACKCEPYQYHYEMLHSKA